MQSQNVMHVETDESNTGVLINKAIDSHNSVDVLDPHDYDKVNEIRHLFDTPEEIQIIYQRLKGSRDSYKGKDVLFGDDKSAVAGVVFEDIMRAYEKQKLYRHKSSRSEIIVRQFHLLNAAKALKKEFPNAGEESVWYCIIPKNEKQKSRPSGELEQKRKIMKNSFSRPLRKIFPIINPTKPILKRKRTKAQPENTAAGAKKKTFKPVFTENDVLSTVEINCNGLVSNESNYNTIRDEYSHLLIREGHRFAKTVLKHFSYLKAYEGKLVSSLKKSG